MTHRTTIGIVLLLALTMRGRAAEGLEPNQRSIQRDSAGQWQADRPRREELAQPSPADTSSRPRDLRTQFSRARKPAFPWRPERPGDVPDPIEADTAAGSGLQQVGERRFDPPYVPLGGRDGVVNNNSPRPPPDEGVRLAQFQSPSGAPTPAPGMSPSTPGSPGATSPGFGSFNQGSTGFGSFNPSTSTGPGTGSFPSGPSAFGANQGGNGMAGGGRAPGGLSALPSTPSMIGDIFSPGGSTSAVLPGSPILSFDGMNTTVVGFTPTTIRLPTPGSSVTGRQKLSENTSPIPRDRVFVNYSYFDNVPLDEGGVDISRLTPGFEKTFMCGRSSFELRMPFADTLSSDLVVGRASDRDWELGNLNLTVKSLFYTDRQLALSGGMGFTLPTADDLRVLSPAGQELARVENESLHLLPFVGFLYTPTPSFFSQGYLQADLDATGNTVLLSNGFGLEDAGNVHDVNLVYVDYGIGFWLFHNDAWNSPSALTGVAPTAEVHYSRSLNDSGVATTAGGQFRVGDVHENVETLNLVLGCTFELYGASSLTLGFATPLINDQDTQFDYEVRIMFNRYFGRRGIAGGNPYAPPGMSY